jgi:hypothetical protein
VQMNPDLPRYSFGSRLNPGGSRVGQIMIFDLDPHFS